MNNLIKIENDGVNVYSTLFVNANKVGIRVLSIMLFLAVIFIITAAVKTDTDEVAPIFFAGIFVLVVFIILPVRYLLWNLYGRETLIVNSKSISFAYDYGWFKTNLKTIEFNKLGTSFEKLQGPNNSSLGKLILWNYRKEDNLPEVIHETSVLIEEKYVHELNENIENLFARERLDDVFFIPFSLS